MSVALASRSGKKIATSSSAWTFYLRLAEAYGWQPVGTLPPETTKATKWEGGYDSNDGQLVLASDSAAMADAVERALSDPARHVKEHEVNRGIAEDVAAMAKAQYGIDLPPDSEDEDLPGAADYAALVAFLRAGEFRIE